MNPQGPAFAGVHAYERTADGVSARPRSPQSRDTWRRPRQSPRTGAGFARTWSPPRVPSAGARPRCVHYRAEARRTEAEPAGPGERSRVHSMVADCCRSCWRHGRGRCAAGIADAWARGGAGHRVLEACGKSCRWRAIRQGHACWAVHRSGACEVETGARGFAATSGGPGVLRLAAGKVMADLTALARRAWRARHSSTMATKATAPGHVANPSRFFSHRRTRQHASTLP